MYHLQINISQTNRLFMDAADTHERIDSYGYDLPRVDFKRLKNRYLLRRYLFFSFSAPVRLKSMVWTHLPGKVLHTLPMSLMSLVSKSVLKYFISNHNINEIYYKN